MRACVMLAVPVGNLLFVRRLVWRVCVWGILWGAILECLARGCPLLGLVYELAWRTYELVRTTAGFDGSGWSWCNLPAPSEVALADGLDWGIYGGNKVKGTWRRCSAFAQEC